MQNNWSTPDNPALCAGNDAVGALFRSGPKTATDVATARRVCFACGHRQGACLQEREATREAGWLANFRGVWAGDYYGSSLKEATGPVRDVTPGRVA